jgi:hypothetical protein
VRRDNELRQSLSFHSPLLFPLVPPFLSALTSITQVRVGVVVVSVVAVSSILVLPAILLLSSVLVSIALVALVSAPLSGLQQLRSSGSGLLIGLAALLVAQPDLIVARSSTLLSISLLLSAGRLLVHAAAAVLLILILLLVLLLLVVAAVGPGVEAEEGAVGGAVVQLVALREREREGGREREGDGR